MTHTVVPTKVGSGLYRIDIKGDIQTTNKLLSDEIVDFGYSIYHKTTGVSLANGTIGTYRNSNLTNNYAAYKLIFAADSVIHAEDTPPLSGQITGYLKENWIKGPNPAFDTLRYRIDAGAWVPVTVDTLESVFIASEGTSLWAFWRAASSSLTTGNHTITVEMSHSFSTPVTPATITKTFNIPVASGGSPGSIDFTVSTDSPIIQTYYVADGQAVTWDFTTATAAMVGTSSPATYSVSGVPGGSTASFFPSSGSWDGSSTIGPSTSLTVNPSGALGGVYPLTVSVTGWGLTRSINITLEVVRVISGGGGGPLDQELSLL
jgi:hypothetical protein